MHNDKKIKEIKDSLCNFQIKPITIIKGTSGIGKLHLVKKILSEFKYQILEVDSSFRDIWILNNIHPLLYSMQDQLAKIDNQRVIILKEISGINNQNQLRQLQQQYTYTKCNKPLLIIVNTTVLKDYELTKILSKEFIKIYCNVILLISPTNIKIEKYLHGCFPRINSNVLHQIAELSNGDLRNAYNQAFIFSINYREESQFKDSQLTFFNTVGRVLYNKRLDQFNTPKQLTYEEMISKPEPKYYFNPFQLLETIQVTQQTYRGFLFINSLKFLHDLTEMKQFYDIQSEADIIEKGLFRYDRYQGDIFNNQYLVSMFVTLGYMQINKHVKPHKSMMLTLNGPQDYQFRQERLLKLNEMKQLKPFKSYQKELVLSILYGKRVQLLNSKNNFISQVPVEEELYDQHWFEEDQLDQQQVSNKKLKQKNIRLRRNQGDMISRNRNQRIVEYNNELFN
ncbi:unnamed protein product [Paramecium sonneborni]|uniref:AAA+ ATPase domain-containing protein n=1 Tax=Paramecium sonneborni TaxID=65129 RepID=A0A8S1KNL8_9CILI|nr:unnamed protein product [Paramecium sonneborni]